MLIEICVGSSCHLKGSGEIVELFKKSISEHKLDEDITLTGSFCVGKCNRCGVTVVIDGEIHTGITPKDFNTFFEKNVLDVIKKERM